MNQFCRSAVVALGVAFLAAPGMAANVFVKIGEITDQRTTRRGDAALTIGLEPYGPGLRNVLGIVDVVLKEAVSDDGADLRIDETGDERFGDVLGDGRWRDLRQVDIRLHNPSRTVRSVRIAGVLKLYRPEGVEGAVVTIPDILTQTGEAPLAHPALSALGVELLLLDDAQARAYRDRQSAEDGGVPVVRSGREGGMVLVARRAEDRSPILRISFLDGQGAEIPVRSWSSNRISLAPAFDRPLPADAMLRVQLAAPEAMIEVPFETGDVFLP
ncbi:MAG: hypothetical protein AAF968_14775 [Pseudomonadota bacterium]